MSLITTEKHRNVQQICSKHIGLPELTPTTKRPTPLYEEALGISASDSIRRAKLTMKIICTMTEGACNSQLCISHGSHRQSEAMASVSFAEGFLPSMRGATRRTALLHRFPRGMATGRWLRRGLWCCAAAATMDEGSHRARRHAAPVPKGHSRRSVAAARAVMRRGFSFFFFFFCFVTASNTITLDNRALPLADWPVTHRPWAATDSMRTFIFAGMLHLNSFWRRCSYPVSTATERLS